MGLTAEATGFHALEQTLKMERQPGDLLIALAGNPNVGKSTVFNGLTGMHQHTGNWPGKTVALAQGSYIFHGKKHIIVDIPGAYSLMAHSAEEEVARDFLCFGGIDAAVVVCDATCLERNINLALQMMEMLPHVLLCVNLMDEAKKKQIHVHLKKLEEELGIPVVGTSAREGKGLEKLKERLNALPKNKCCPKKLCYSPEIEEAIQMVEKAVSPFWNGAIQARWVSLKLLQEDTQWLQQWETQTNAAFFQQPDICQALAQAKAFLLEKGIDREKMQSSIVETIYQKAEAIAKEAVSLENLAYLDRQMKIDRILTNRWAGIPIMLLLLAVIFWITIEGANFPSALLSKGLFWLQDRLSDLFHWLGAPEWLHGAIVLGMFRVTAWVVSVMLPPMAIFFPLFTLLEDLGYLPRVAFNLDKQFKKCNACGKQALTMCSDLKRMRPLFANPHGRGKDQN